eukprot:CAMPEP_0170225236 /NCGR_PEP_ID=MMETSP0116_2-20130129/12325_1 /TAXON_ID=400756 /ORGANISM="Durinskia baltica, Strain CSIRO CS-38" /LENGTH=228 /DNA_ID=CAMNT_0010475953 /DNA_START=83 /DNA_END=769 /DNA_ORIENTATION=-
MSSVGARLAALLITATAFAAAPPATCPPDDFDSTDNFDLDTYISKPWYVQQQMEVSYLPASQNRNVRAQYARKQGWSLFRYDLSVYNHAEDLAEPHNSRDAKLCAKVVDALTGKLKVAPCFLPPFLAGPYWVVAYDESEGYALVSGGPPEQSAPGGCRTGNGVNGAGLWIFTRKQARDQALVDKVREIAKDKGFDLSVLNDVLQVGGGDDVVQKSGGSEEVAKASFIV